MPLKKPRQAKHARILDLLPYPEWAELSVEIHGGELDACGVCGRMPSDGRHHDRDHDHTTGLPRGLACGGDFGCNVMMPRKLTATLARANADAMALGNPLIESLRPYLPRDLTPERAEQIAAYLERSNGYYLKGMDDAAA